eukprot:TRINITY_DN51172_c1_g1_i5.p1 TRINITY_DN51172_c1_g1~~TRINITY_DN51172_c1_g1_i5.p1  ORF type:complete len:101 (-),score=12.16 TRINITY_DN51172_c1_g1_i5:20-322(-)
MFAQINEHGTAATNTTEQGQTGSGRHGTKSMSQQLSILQWNCRAFRGKVPFLLNYLQAQPQRDVLMLQSLYLEPKSIPHLDGYYYPPVMGIEIDSHGSHV